jgi:3-oxoacyl-[acyl-carrier-protein] synthase II
VAGQRTDKCQIVVTGMGVLAPNGSTLGDFWDALVNGRNAIGRVTAFDCSGFTSQMDAEIKDFDPLRYLSAKDARRMDRFAQLATSCALLAFGDSGIDLSKENPERIGVLIGSGIGGIKTIADQHQLMLEKGPKHISPFLIPMLIINIASGYVSMLLKIKGPNLSVATACATSNHAIGEAMNIIREGLADVMIAGGSEAPLMPLGYGGFCAMKALSTRNDEPEKASRPFDKERDGFIMGEGAGILVLESLEHAKKRGARIYCELAGFGMTADAYHITAPSPDGEGAARCMQLALEDAHISPEEVDHINAHGTSTPLNDKVETIAIKKVFGDHAYKMPISSTKSMIGHLMGAAGAVELIAAIFCLRNNVAHPTINYEFPDPDCDLDYVPNIAREHKIDVVLSNSLGFGGHNATLVVRRL